MTRPELVRQLLTERNAKTGIRPKNKRSSRSRFSLNRRQVVWVVILLCLFMLSSIGYVWSNFEHTQIGYDLSQLKKKERELREANQKLRAELAFLKSPLNLERMATEKLGLRQPSPEQVVVLP